MAMTSAANPPNRYLLTRHTGIGRPVPAVCRNEAETADIEQHQGDERTGPEQHDSNRDESRVDRGRLLPPVA